MTCDIYSTFWFQNLSSRIAIMIIIFLGGFYCNHLQNYRLKQVLGLVNSLNSLCGVLGMDYKHTIHEIHPTLNDSGGVKGITDDIIKRLVTVIQSFREVKMQRMQRVSIFE